MAKYEPKRILVAWSMGGKEKMVRGEWIVSIERKSVALKEFWANCAYWR